MTHGSTFTGIGGFDLAAKWMGWDNVFHCEFDKRKRIHLERNFPNSKSHGDIRETNFTTYRGLDVLSGGFPCQDASTAKTDGKGQQGLQGARTGLLFEMLRAVRESGAKYVVAENVANILKTNKGRDFRTILGELAAMGYNAEWRVCRASEVGAPHQRSRLYLVAYPNSVRRKQGETFFSYVHETALPFTWKPFGATIQISRGAKWGTEPPILCVDDGVSSKLVREHLHGYGNAVVPEIPYRIFKAIEQFEKITNHVRPTPV